MNNRVVVDDSEVKSKVPEILGQLGLEVELQSLDGKGYDYQWINMQDKRVVAQRKTWSDFLNSISDGRLMDDAQLCSQEEEAYLIVEGMFFVQTHKGVDVSWGIDKWKDAYYTVKVNKRDWNPNAIYGMLMSVAPYFTAIIPTANSEGTATFIQTGMLHSYKLVPKKGLKPLPLSLNPRVEKFMNIPNIGYETASKLASNYISLVSLGNATVEEIMMIKGIGRVTAEQIKEWLNE